MDFCVELFPNQALDAPAYPNIEAIFYKNNAKPLGTYSDLRITTKNLHNSAFN